MQGGLKWEQGAEPPGLLPLNLVSLRETRGLLCQFTISFPLVALVLVIVVTHCSV